MLCHGPRNVSGCNPIHPPAPCRSAAVLVPPLSMAAFSFHTTSHTPSSCHPAAVLVPPLHHRRPHPAEDTERQHHCGRWVGRECLGARGLPQHSTVFCTVWQARAGRLCSSSCAAPQAPLYIQLHAYVCRLQGVHAAADVLHPHNKLCICRCSGVDCPHAHAHPKRPEAAGLHQQQGGLPLRSCP